MNRFLEVMGSSQESKILDYLLDLEDCEVTLTDIVEGIGTYRNRAYKILRKFIRLGILVEKNRKVKLNKKSPIVKILLQLNQAIIKQKQEEMTYSHIINNGVS